MSVVANLRTAQPPRLLCSCHNFLSTRSRHMSTDVSFSRSNVLLTPLLLSPLLNGQCTPPVVPVVPYPTITRYILKVLLILQDGATTIDSLMVALVLMLLLPPLTMIPVALCLPQKVFSDADIWVQTREHPICFYSLIESQITSSLPSDAPLVNRLTSLPPHLPIMAVHPNNSLTRRPPCSRRSRGFHASKYYTALFPIRGQA